jgi:hypothetical protein
MRAHQQMWIALAATAVVVAACFALPLGEIWLGEQDPSAPHDDAVVEAAGGYIARSRSGVRSLRPVRELERAVKADPLDARAWSDLATVRLQHATEKRHPSELPPALVAADRALRLSPALAAARFSRAAIIEELGNESAAARAWRSYLETDPASDRAAIALQHLHRLNAPTSEELWLEARVRLEHAPDAEIDSIASAFTNRARAYAEVVLLAAWGKAHLAGDTATAARNLRIAQRIGLVLRREFGEQLLSEAVERITRATSAEALQLARAHIDYEAARYATKATQFSLSIHLSQRCARDFARLDDPAAGLCRLTEAIALMQLQRNDAAMAALDALQSLERNAERAHAALRAQTLWHVCLVETLNSHWNSALDACSQSFSEHVRLREHAFAGRVETMIAEIHDLLGLPERGWVYRVEASRMLARAGDLQALHTNTASGTFAAIAARDWPAAQSLAALDMTLARELGDADLIARAHLRGALIQLRLKNSEAALEEVQTGRRELAHLREPDAGVRTRADLDRAEALIRRATSPRESLELLDRAANAYRRAGLGLYLPATELERGQTYLTLRDERSAAQSFDGAIALLLDQRARVTTAELRASMFDNASDVFDEALRLALRRNAPGRAFRIVESARARALLDEIETRTSHRLERIPSIADLQGAIGRNAFVELAVLPEKVAGLVVLSGTVRSFEIPYPARDLDRDIDEFVRLVSGRGDPGTIRTIARGFYERIVAPAGLPPDTPLVISADGPLQRMPWAALYEPKSQRYLIEERTLLLTPSAGIFIANSRRTNERGRLRNVLVIGDPAFDRQMFPDLAALAGGRNEAAAIRSLYPAGDSATGREATRSLFLRTAPQYAVIHFAGHSVAGLMRGEDSFLVFAQEPYSSSLLYASDISRMTFPATQLVVLATCSSLRGPTRGKEGMPAIARGFLAAGVPAVAGTLWDVEDEESSLLFTTMHEQLAAGASAADALRAAQLLMLHSRNPRLAHPATWAGAQILGGGLIQR